MQLESKTHISPLLTIESPVAQWLELPTRSWRVVSSNPILAPIFPSFQWVLSTKGGAVAFMVSVLYSGSSGPGSGPGQGHCVVFLGKTRYSHGASLHPGLLWVPANLMLG